MSRYNLSGLAILLLACPVVTRADHPEFSGPQAGETLPPFQAQGVFGELAGKGLI